ncbi:helix-turn-helix transcriptional regulator [Frigoribacterium sp. SL97]|uniref:helix-turn-helix transcriptional regulator n=1 Tax=Frigoribacterium sp. SL97 TaxID=2994664 RepID=UPI002270926C|nr:helix-turn-helix domain-containing protein [Frigoribacterium sp. SL97]WAC50572.1 helix-turn-helix domain-containing protein [Frigoribacterium sp. SL97]
MTTTDLTPTGSTPLLKEYLTLDELSIYIQIPKRTIHHLRSKGTGPVGRKVGRSLRFSRKSVDAWFEALPASSGGR